MPHLGPGKAAGGIWGFKQHMLLNLLNLLVYAGAPIRGKGENVYFCKHVI